MRDISNSNGLPDDLGGSDNYSGQLLLAHPELSDPNFRKAVILLSAHSPEEGALGVVINRPLGKTLSEHAPEFLGSPLGEIPLYQGGPVQTDQMILAAWEFLPDEGTFRLFFGIDEEKAREIISENPAAHLRGFLGYAGWGEKQLETELEQETWLVSPIDGGAVQESDGEDLWKSIVSRADPEMRFRLDAPDDPSLN